MVSKRSDNTSRTLGNPNINCENPNTAAAAAGSSSGAPTVESFVAAVITLLPVNQMSFAPFSQKTNTLGFAAAGESSGGEAMSLSSSIAPPSRSMMFAPSSSSEFQPSGSGFAPSSVGFISLLGSILVVPPSNSRFPLSNFGFAPPSANICFVSPPSNT